MANTRQILLGLRRDLDEGRQNEYAVAKFLQHNGRSDLYEALINYYYAREFSDPDVTS